MKVRRRRSDATDAPRHDRGYGMIEILVSVVLLGLGATSTLTAISVAVKGSAEESRLSGGRLWLISAADYVVSDNVARVACTSGESTVRSAYQSAAQTVTTSRPSGWAASQISVLPTVLFWDGSTFTSTCYETNGLILQEFTLQTTSPKGEVETLTVVKRDG